MCTRAEWNCRTLFVDRKEKKKASSMYGYMCIHNDVFVTSYVDVLLFPNSLVEVDHKSKFRNGERRSRVRKFNCQR